MTHNNRVSHTQDPVTDQQTVWLTRQQLADRWQRPKSTLAQWASKGIGPRYATFGGRVRYSLTDVLAYEQSCFNREAAAG